MTKVFIDGSYGTTGLQIYDRIRDRDDLELITISEELKKDMERKAECINSADIAFFCLPDAASVESLTLVSNPDTVIIDTSTAHRTLDDWTYGFAEINGQRERISKSKRIANPGCHASGFISLIQPLVQAGFLNADAKLSCFSLTGYSGGGKKMVADYENGDNASALQAPRMYGLSQNHKHLPEMKKVCGLSTTPVFCPVVSSFYSGMESIVPIFKDDLSVGIEELKEYYKEYYQGQKLVSFVDDSDENGFMSSGALSGYDNMEISVYGNEDRILLVSRFDNLGKGASGSAIQNMNIVLGIDETTGLKIKES